MRRRNCPLSPTKESKRFVVNDKRKKTQWTGKARFGIHTSGEKKKSQRAYTFRARKKGRGEKGGREEEPRERDGSAPAALEFGARKEKVRGHKWKKKRKRACEELKRKKAGPVLRREAGNFTSKKG